MKTTKLVLLGVGAALSVASSAYAAGGCGVGFHRGPAGGCRPNGGGFVGPGAPVIGTFYPGHGYWHGDRYWGNRYRWHGGWRYR